MKREKTMKMTKFGFIIGALAAAALLFGACGNLFDPPNTQPELENGMARVRVNLVGMAAPSALQRVATAQLPSWSDTVTYEYYFDPAGKPQAADVTPEQGDGSFLVPAGSYTLRVKGFVMVSTTKTQVVEGTSTQFTVPSNNVVNVTLEPYDLTGNSSVKGKLNISISFPTYATAIVTLDNWSSGSGSPETITGATNANGLYTKTGLELSGGSYLLTVALSTEVEGAAGSIEVIQIYPGLTTVYAKDYSEEDLGVVTNITGAAITLPFSKPLFGTAVPNTTAVSNINIDPRYTITNVAWTDSNANDATITGTFTDEKAKVVVTLTKRPGYLFANANSFTGTIAGKTASVVFNSRNQIATLTYTFADAAREVDSIEVTTPPSKLAYMYGEKLDLEDLELTLKDEDDETIAVVGFVKATEEFVDADGNKWTVTVAPTLTTPLTIAIHDEAIIVFTIGSVSSAADDDTVELSVGENTEPLEIGDLTTSFTYSAANQRDAIVNALTALVVDSFGNTVPAANFDLDFEGDVPAQGSDPAELIELKDAGTYTGTITTKGALYTYNDIATSDPVNDPLTFTVTIGPKDISAATVVVAAASAYDGTEKKPSITSVTAITSNAIPADELADDELFEISYSNNINATTTESLGLVTISVVADDYNYTGTVTQTFAIGKGTLTADNFTVPSSLNRPTYDGTAKAAIVQYIGTQQNDIGDISIASYKNAAGTAVAIADVKNVGSYTVLITVTAGGNYAAITGAGLELTNSGTLDIQRAIVAEPLITPDLFTAITAQAYDGTAKSVLPNAITLKSGGTVTGLGTTVTNIQYNGQSIAPTNVGTYTIRADFDAGTNFRAGTSVVGTFTISKKAPALADFDVKVNDAAAIPSGTTVTVTGDGTPQAVTLSPKSPKSGVGAMTVTYTASTTGATASTQAPTAAGSYTVKFAIESGVNFEATGEDAPLSLTLTIN